MISVENEIYPSPMLQDVGDSEEEQGISRLRSSSSEYVFENYKKFTKEITRLRFFTPHCINV